MNRSLLLPSFFFSPLFSLTVGSDLCKQGLATALAKSQVPYISFTRRSIRFVPVVAAFPVGQLFLCSLAFWVSLTICFSLGAVDGSGLKHPSSRCIRTTGHRGDLACPQGSAAEWLHSEMIRLIAYGSDNSEVELSNRHVRGKVLCQNIYRALEVGQ